MCDQCGAKENRTKEEVLWDIQRTERTMAVVAQSLVRLKKELASFKND